MTVLFDADDVAMDIQRVANDVYDIVRHTPPKDVVFVGILTNGVFLAKRVRAALAKRQFVIPDAVMALDVTLYRDDHARSKKTYLTVESAIQTVGVDGKHVVLFDDVLCTARTVRAALNAIFDYGRPEKVHFSVLYDRGHRQVPIQPNVVARHLDVPMDLRVNTVFFEVMGEDLVKAEPFPAE
jgi:pyrimidine operon attenuation protein/uracil phosphoribosyltransferase